MSIQPRDYELICKLVYDESGIALSTEKEYLVESRLDPIVKEEGLESLEVLAGLLRRGEATELVKRVVDAMTTNETSFFRDVTPFQALQDQILPALIERRRDERTLNIWCAASSSGQEPITLAMVIREYFPEVADWNIHILATDISETMLDRCRAGLYSQLEVSRGLPARMLVKYFKKEGVKWKVSDEVQGMVDFRHLNLIEPFPHMPRMDLVMIRNVMIYFDEATKISIQEKIRCIMNRDGCLMMGTAETVLNNEFQRVQSSQATYYTKAA